MKKILTLGLLGSMVLLSVSANADTNQSQSLEAYTDASGRYAACQTIRVRTPEAQSSRCTVWVEFSNGTLVNSWANQQATRGAANPAADCSRAAAIGMAKCEDYRRYDARPQGSGSCSVKRQDCFANVCY